jgi:hypothetical protein
MSICDFAENESRVLGIEIRRERCAGSPGAAGVEKDELGGAYGMAMRTEETREIDGAAE